jgi:hypothetical protein
MHKKSYNSNCSMIFLGIKCPNDTTNPTSNCPLTHFGGHLCNGNFCSSEYNFTGFALPLIVVTTSNLFNKVPFYSCVKSFNVKSENSSVPKNNIFQGGFLGNSLKCRLYSNCTLFLIKQEINLLKPIFETV